MRCGSSLPAAVVALHYAEYAKDNAAAHFVFAHVQHFNLFVDLFFVISGFVIARQYLQEWTRRTTSNASSGGASRASIRCTC